MNMQDKDIKTLGYVLKRINYGEFDRILNIITPVGKFSVIAKGVRKERSKLAGSIELLTLIEFNIHKGRSDFGIVTGAKMIKHYSEIVKDFTKMEFSAMILKMANKLAENSDSPEYFKIVDQSLKMINSKGDLGLVKAWAFLNFKKAMGEEINLYRDIDGKKLASEKRYDWDDIEMVFMENKNGQYGVDEIKFLRLMVSNDLNVLYRVKNLEDMMPAISHLVRTVI